MSDVRDPETDQQLPKVNDKPFIQNLVIADIEARKALGLKKYKTLLQAGNGRNMLLDAYEESLDLCIYLRGALEEQREKEDVVEDFTASDTPLWEAGTADVDCCCTDPIPVNTGYNFPVCLTCANRVPDSKLAHKQ